MKNILKDIASVGGKALKVGGCVRDHILGIQCKDIDIEVYNISIESLHAILSKYGKVDSVGKSFGILKFTYEDQEYDFSIPRRENKVGVNHTDFEVIIDSNMSVREAASRRDFTINSMAMDFDNNIIDPFHGRADIQSKILRPTSKKFLEDPLRILRGMQFAGRFGMRASEEMIQYGSILNKELCFISKDRVWHEWYKLMTKSVKPSYGIQFLVDTNCLRCFPDLFRMETCIQQPEWHPEGNCLVHTQYVMDYANSLCEQKSITGDDKAVILFAALLHDVGKPDTTIFKDGHIRSPGHAEAGVNISHEFLESIKCPHHIIDRVLPLVKYHMVHIGVDATPKFVRRLVNKLYPATLPELTTIIRSDIGGRPPLDPTPSGVVIDMENIFYNIQKEMDKGKVKPIVLGRHLVDMGVESGPEMGAILKDIYNLQLDGEFSSLEEGLLIAKEKVQHVS